ncbi:acetyltransferase (GNAT) family protein [Kordia sp. SMS9]|uniref:GNAT family N-acetyltransferase n=1 Tax=Kordia sp. SMS9 TaxID=2282170 RepID=UPI000E10D58B|nr:acetyltransferase (GNAT) family protein [Kordia sp. SMS9]
MNLTTKRTNSKNQDFINLVKELDAFLSIQNGESDEFYSQFNGLEELHHIIVLYLDDAPIGCGAIKQFDENTVEVKRMYISQKLQGKSLGITILSELETWARELGNIRCVLETGTMLPEAIRFYEKNNYQRIPNYEPYIDAPESVCFEKHL